MTVQALQDRFPRAAAVDLAAQVVGV
jgi:hypothetical protein